MPIAEPPPLGSRIEVRETLEGLELRMPAPRGFLRWLVAGFLTFWLGGWVVGEVGVAYFIAVMIQQGGRAALIVVPFLTVWLAFWTYGGISAFRTAWALVRGRAERLILSPDGLQHQPGGAANLFRLAVPPRRAAGFASFRPRIPEAWPRGEVESIKIVYRQSGPQLVVRRGEERIRLGWPLGEPELEWLRDLLLDWHAGRRIR